MKKQKKKHYTSTFCGRQVSVTLENFQDISLPIPGKEDLAKLHSSTHQTSLVKAGSCGEAYAPQGWIAFVMEYIKRCVYNPYAVFFIYLFLHQAPLSSCFLFLSKIHLLLCLFLPLVGSGVQWLHYKTALQLSLPEMS